MTITIQNLSDKSIFLRFNSGQTQYLAAHDTIADVAATEIKSNAKIDKLVNRRLISVAQAPASASTKRRSRKSTVKKSDSK